MTTPDPLYLDGSQPYHRHPHDGRGGVDPGTAAGCALDALPVRVFDEDALTAHDNAIRQQTEQGTTPAPLYRPDQWEFAILEPVEPGQEATDARVMAGWTPSGEFLRYVTPERLVRALREHVEGER